MYQTPKKVQARCLALAYGIDDPDIIKAFRRVLRPRKKKHADVRPVESPYLTVPEAAAYCRVSASTIYHQSRHIERAPGAGRRLVFTREALDDWLSKRRRKSRPR